MVAVKTRFVRVREPGTQVSDRRKPGNFLCSVFSPSGHSMSNVHRGACHCPCPEHRLPPYHYFPRVTQLNFSPHFTPPVPTCFLRIAFCPTNSYCPMFPSPVLQRHQLHPPQTAAQYTYLQSPPAIPPQPSQVTTVAPPLPSPHTSSDPSSSHNSPSSSHSNSSSSTLDEDEQSKYQKVATQLLQSRTALAYSHADVGRQLGRLCHTVFGGSTVSSFESGKMPLNMVRKFQPTIQSWLQATLNKTDLEQLHADRKRPRTSIDQLSKEKLEVYFKTCNKPLPSEILTISEAIGLDKGYVQTWFCNRRQREKRKAEHKSNIIPSTSHDITLIMDDPSASVSTHSLPVYIDEPPN